MSAIHPYVYLKEEELNHLQACLARKRHLVLLLSVLEKKEALRTKRFQEITTLLNDLRHVSTFPPILPTNNNVFYPQKDTVNGNFSGMTPNSLSPQSNSAHHSNRNRYQRFSTATLPNPIQITQRIHSPYVIPSTRPRRH